jgi:integrase
MPRARGTGRIFRRGQVFWVAYYGPDPRHPSRRKRFFESTGSTDRRDAERLLRQRLHEIHGDNFVGPQQERVTVAELLKQYQTHRELNGVKSPDKFRSHLKRVEEFFGATRACDITTPGLEAWAGAKMKPQGPYAKATVKQWLALLRAAMRLPMKRGFPLRVPAFPTIEVKNARNGFLEPEEFQAIVAALEQPWADIARFAYETMWRLSEILSLTWDMVDRRNGIITLPDSKSGESRVIPIVGELVGMLERRWAARVVGTRLSPLVFHKRGQRIQSFRKRWGNACGVAGLKGVLFHDLRRTGARDSRNARVAEGVIMKRAGWKTRHVFERYNIVSLDDQRQAALQTQEYRTAQLATVADVTKIGDSRRGDRRQSKKEEAV